MPRSIGEPDEVFERQRSDLLDGLAAVFITDGPS